LVAAPLVVAAELFGVEDAVPLMPPVLVVELLGVAELVWSVVDCGAGADPLMLLVLPVESDPVADWVAVVPPFCPVGVLAVGTVFESVVVLLFIWPTRSLEVAEVLGVDVELL